MKYVCVFVVPLSGRKIAAVDSLNKGPYCEGPVHFNYYFTRNAAVCLLFRSDGQSYCTCIDILAYVNLFECYIRIRNTAEGIHESLVSANLGSPSVRPVYVAVMETVKTEFRSDRLALFVLLHRPLGKQGEKSCFRRGTYLASTLYSPKGSSKYMQGYPASYFHRVCGLDM